MQSVIKTESGPGARLLYLSRSNHSIRPVLCLRVPRGWTYRLGTTQQTLGPVGSFLALFDSSNHTERGETQQTRTAAKAGTSEWKQSLTGGPGVVDLHTRCHFWESLVHQPGGTVSSWYANDRATLAKDILAMGLASRVFTALWSSRL